MTSIIQQRSQTCKRCTAIYTHKHASPTTFRAKLHKMGWYFWQKGKYKRQWLCRHCTELLEERI